MKPYLDADILEVLRNKVWNIQKLDFAYITAFGALITVLKISRYELFSLLINMYMVLGAFLIIVTIDVLISDLVFREWVLAKRSSPKRTSANFLVGLVSTQMIMHWVFLLCIGSYTVGSFYAVAEYKEEYENLALIQEEIDQFIFNKESSPTSLEILEKENPNIALIFDKLNGQDFKYKKTGKKNYAIIFGGRDKKIGTKDDIFFTQNIRIRNVFENIIRGISESEMSNEILPTPKR